MGGHAFVCDGYNENTDKFHFNWGNNGGNNYLWCTIDSIIEGSYNWNHLERAVFNIYPAGTQDYCNFEMPLWIHYYHYYNMYGNTTPDPYANVPKTFTRLTSVPNDPQFPSTWRTIPTGATSEYVAHEEVLLQDGFLAETGSDFHAYIVPCEPCDEERVTMLTVYPNPTDDLLHIELRGAGIAEAVLYDLQGRVVETMCTSSLQGTESATLNVRNVPAGIYLLRVTDTEGCSYSRKVTIR